jgi:hypothetical protein
MSFRVLPKLLLTTFTLAAGTQSPFLQAQSPKAAAPLVAPIASGGSAPEAAPATPAASGLTTVKGTVADPDSAVIPGATVTLTSASGKAAIVLSQSDGTYSFQNVRPGLYSLTVTMPGFASFVKQGIRIPASGSLTIDARMAIQEQQQQVNVNATGTTLSVDSDSNASSTVIKGKDLDALSDDPDELSDELSALAGPSAGPNGGQIYVDGFTGGQLPPKSSIREIRINQNPFSAQYDRVGYGRVEVFTKPGTDKFHGFFQTNGNANFFNTGSPLLGDVPQLPYHTIFVFGNLTGPVNTKASFTLGGSHRIIQDNSIFFGNLYSNPANPTVLCAPADPACVATAQPVSIPTLFPQVRTDFTPRFDYQLAEKNTLTLRYQFETNSQNNDGIGSLDLPSTGYNITSTENEIQMVDTQILSDRLINETRFEYGRDKSSQTPLTVAPTVSVQGTFTGGGSNTQVVNDHQDHFEVQNYTSLALAHNFIRFGGRLRTTRDANYSDSQSLGNFSYSSLLTPAATPDSTQVVSSYQNGQASQYTVAVITQPSVHATLADLGIYAEDDWKPKPNLTVSYGLRFETQNHIADHADFAPRLSVAYGLGSKKGTPQTVVRGGFGIFYDRFSLTNVITTLQENGTNQTLYNITNPVANCTDLTSCSGGSATPTGQTTYTISPRLHSPYLMQAAIGVDEQLGKIGTVSINYLNMRGVHEFNSYNLTPPVLQDDGTYLPGPTNDYQFASDGVFRQNQLNISPRISYGRSISLWGYYSLNYAKADSSGAGSFPSVVNNLKADYGRASFDTRSRLYMGGTYSAPYRISISPFMVAVSGNPFNIITGTDLNGDSILSNDRPAFASAATSAQNLVVTPHGSFDKDPAPGTPRIPVYYGTGPANFSLNFRLTKTIGFGPELARSPAAGQSQGGPSGPPPPGGGGGRGHGGGPGGPFGGGGSSSGRRFNVSLGASVNNVFNVVDRGTPNGVVSSPEFYKSTTLAGNIFSTNSAVRRITLLATFSF